MQERLCGVNCNDYSLKRQNFIYLCHSGAYYYYYNFPHHFMSHPLLPLRVNISSSHCYLYHPALLGLTKFELSPWTMVMKRQDQHL